MTDDDDKKETLPDAPIIAANDDPAMVEAHVLILATLDRAGARSWEEYAVLEKFLLERWRPFTAALTAIKSGAISLRKSGPE
jgi:hypothetical protein